MLAIVCRPDWHATQLFVALVFVAASVASWSSDHVSLIVRHHRLEMFDKVQSLFALHEPKSAFMLLR